jgi:hypothetical protein
VLNHGNEGGVGGIATTKLWDTSPTFWRSRGCCCAMVCTLATPMRHSCSVAVGESILVVYDRFVSIPNSYSSFSCNSLLLRLQHLF